MQHIRCKQLFIRNTDSKTNEEQEETFDATSGKNEMNLEQTPWITYIVITPISPYTNTES